MSLAGLRWAKGHGTENDFVLLHDPDGELELTPDQVRRLCDRRTGIGGDGVLRVVQHRQHWFMDYRNADGTTAEMCGNGIRVFAAYLEYSGLEKIDDEHGVVVATRAGLHTVKRVPGESADWYSADLGPWRVVGGEASARAGSDVTVQLAGSEVAIPGLAIDVGNPHVVTALADPALLAQVDLSRAPVVEPAPVADCNVEVVVPGPTTSDGRGQLSMRVYERGVGPTRSCGTGAVAAVLAARVWGGAGAPEVWSVDVPGGRLEVVVPPLGPGSAESGRAALLAGESVLLSGPAVIVAEGRLL
jgi:diaminopimelate epimerase